MMCFRKLPVRKKIIDRRGGGSIKIFGRQFFCLTVPEIFVGEPFILCFRKRLVAKKFMDEREGELSRFPPEIFCLTVPKNFVGEPFCASQNF